MKALKFVLQNARNLFSSILLIDWTRQALVAREQIIMGKGKILTYYIFCKINNMRSLKKTFILCNISITEHFPPTGINHVRILKGRRGS